MTPPLMRAKMLSLVHYSAPVAVNAANRTETSRRGRRCQMPAAASF